MCVRRIRIWICMGVWGEEKRHRVGKSVAMWMAIGASITIARIGRSSKSRCGTSWRLRSRLSWIWPWSSRACSFFSFQFVFRPFLSFWDTKQYSTAKIERQDHEDEERRTRTHLAVRPLRFRDGTPHPCAKVPTIRFSLTSASAVCISQAQVLGDYILLWVWPGEDDYSLSKLYLIAWKHGSITLVSIHYLSYTGLWW